jgi:hypothetical protein
MRRKFKSVTVDLTQYINILFVLNLIFESMLVPDINWPGLVFAFKNIFLQMNYREIAITKGTNHFITGVEGSLVFLLSQKNYIQVSLNKYFILLYIKKI